MTVRTSDVVQAGLILGCGAGLLVAGLELRRHEGGSARAGVEDLLGLGLSALGLCIVAAWLLTLALAIATELLAGHGRTGAARVCSRFTPALMRRLAVAVLGINLLAVPTLAHAAPMAADPSNAVPSGSSTVTEVLRPGTGAPAAGLLSWRSDPTADGPTTVVPDPVGEHDTAEQQEAPTPVSPAWRPAPLPVDGGLLLRQGTRAERQSEEVVVVQGDSLWSIAGKHLGPLATASDIAEAWPAWFEVNRRIIGEDPSVLVPGQVLIAPPH